MTLRWTFLAIVIISATKLRAGHTVVFEPSLQVKAVNDDNLNSSVEEPLADRIERITPALALRLDSPRWRVFGNYSFDREHYLRYSRLDSDKARERASIAVEYRVAPRLSLALNSAYIDTNTLTELNADSGLASSRARARRLSFAPSAAFRISSRVTATAAASSVDTNIVDGQRTRIQNQMLAIERRITLRDRFRIDYEHSLIVYTGTDSQTIDTYTMLAGWTRDFGPRNQWTVAAGPRITNRTRSLDVAASATHGSRFSSVALSYVRTQTTVIGHAGPVDAQRLEGRFTVAPNRRLSGYIAPALVRSAQGRLEATVARAAVGARYAINSIVDLEIAYNRDQQAGTLDSQRPDAKLSHSILSVGFVTRAR